MLVAFTGSVAAKASGDGLEDVEVGYVEIMAKFDTMYDRESECGSICMSDSECVDGSESSDVSDHSSVRHSYDLPERRLYGHRQSTLRRRQSQRHAQIMLP